MLMNAPLRQHQLEIERNRRAWEAKPLLREIYAGFYARIRALIPAHPAGRVVELGSGIGNLKSHLPGALATDLFPNPWLDVVCDAYELPFAQGSVSHLILFDVFHHLRAPGAFLREARRVIEPEGSVILFEPFVSMTSYLVYGALHSEPLGMEATLNLAEYSPRPRDYYAAQGNATRLFFRHETPGWPQRWDVFHREAIAGFSYLLSGGFSRPAFYPCGWLAALLRLDQALSRWPRLFGARCLIGLRPIRER